MSLNCDLIVVGGGPAGSTVAALCAKAGLDVLLLEADQHPRVHVGESLLPGIIPILAEMGALEAVESAGFGLKTGTTHWNWGLTPKWDLWFSETDLYDHAWLVERSRFDEILFRAAGRAGARTLEQAAVKELIWGGDRLVGVRWRQRGEDGLHEARAKFVVDASGQAAVVARELKLRNHIPGLAHQASWAHFEDAGHLPPPRQNQAFFVAEKGHWLWLFPFGGGRASVGIIHLDDNGASTEADRTRRFDELVRASELFSPILGESARRVTPVRTQRDWSYRMSQVGGPGWLLVGDASGFLDPVLSTGVFLGMHAAYSAAQSIKAVLGQGADEAAEISRYQRQHEANFSDLLRVVRFYYQQNFYKEDYFWESKRILINEHTNLKPHKSFLILTSGLVKNLALQEKSEDAVQRREEMTRASRPVLPIEDDAPEKLDFVCFNFAYHMQGDQAAQLYMVMEPSDPGSPTLFRTRNWHVNWMAPRFDNDVIRFPELEPHVRMLADRIRALDTVASEPLARFWQRTRSELVAAVRGLPAHFELVRVFGE